MYCVAQPSFFCPVFCSNAYFVDGILVMCALVAGVWNTKKPPTKYITKERRTL
jgi:hypothetical protein